jgi:hypothetical protein
MDKAALLAHLAAIDARLQTPATLCIYGSGACILLDEPGRITLDLDVAAPYSQANYADLEQAARRAGFPVNPDQDYSGEYIEWISALRLCLPRPAPETELLLWRGSKLTVKTVSVSQLIASKLIRYDEIDRTDIQYLCSQNRVPFAAVAAAAASLPEPFAKDPLVRDNLDNLRADLALWQEG